MSQFEFWVFVLFENGPNIFFSRFCQIWSLRFVTVCVFEFCHNLIFLCFGTFWVRESAPCADLGNMSKSILVRVYYLKLQPWYTSYKLPEYVFANFWVNAKKKEYLAWNCDLATMLKVKGFYNRESLKFLRMFLKKVDFVSIFLWKNLDFKFLRLPLISIVISKI